jgi:hypothetical protein
MSSALETLCRVFAGDIIEPGGPEYETARRTVLASGSPAYVLRPLSVADVPPPGIQIVTRSAFVDPESVPTVLGLLAETATSERSPFIAVRSVGGAVSRVSDDATAYAHRRAELMFVTTHRGAAAGHRCRLAGAGGDLAETATAHQRRVCELPHLHHADGCRRHLPGTVATASRRPQAPVRPRQPLQPQPQRPTRWVILREHRPAVGGSSTASGDRVRPPRGRARRGPGAAQRCRVPDGATSTRRAGTAERTACPPRPGPLPFRCPTRADRRRCP